MDARENLLELLYTAHNKVAGVVLEDDEKTYSDAVGMEADELIANGVTVQEWIPVDDSLPEHGDVVLCFMKFGEHRILQWDNVSSLWLGYGHGDDWQKADVTHWMPLPPAPEDMK